MSSIQSFKERHSLSRRRDVVNSHYQNYPDRCPINLFRSRKDLKVPSKAKYLAPSSSTFASFIIEARKHIEVGEYEGIFMFIHVKGNIEETVMVRASDNIGAIYEKYKDVDGFLYISYDVEKCFG